MGKEIVNRVANSDLITIDLSDYAPAKTFGEIDLKQFLFEGFILKEKEFRSALNDFDFNAYENKKVIVKGCGHIKLTEAFYIAITKKLQNTVSSLMFGEACSAVPVFKKK